MADETNVYDFYEHREKLQREKLKKAVKVLDKGTAEKLAELKKCFEAFEKKHSKSFNSEITIKGDIV